MKSQVTVYFLIFGTILLLILGGVFGVVTSQMRAINRKLASQQAFQIAEAGVEFYKWCLNHQISCPTEKTYFNSAGVKIGTSTISEQIISQCGQIIQRKITVAGFTEKFPKIKREIEAIFAKPSIGKLSYVLNSNVWIGQDYEIRGPYHSNGGIRMDGENQSLVTSAVNEWQCTSSFGCDTCPTSAGCYVSDSKCMCPGVFTTANGQKDLFQFPAPPFDFGRISVDLVQLKNIAKNSGIYLNKAKSVDSNGKGYHLIFKETGEVEIKIITQLSPTYAYSLEEGWHYDYFRIASEYSYRTYSIPSGCSVIFVEDNIWPEGKIAGNVTLVSANLIDPNIDTQAILQGNIEYRNSNLDTFTLIAENNILISPDSPNIMELSGVFIAQKGRFSRNHYPGNIKEKLEIKGTIVSNGRVGTQWTSGGTIVSGYRIRESYFDPRLSYFTSPFTPTLEDNFSLVKWQEK